MNAKGRKVFLSLFLVFLFWQGRLWAAEEKVDLDKIVVTPYRFEEDVHNIPSAVSVITATQIEESNAVTIPDVLATQTGIIVRDYYGTGTKVAVDLRGFGESAGSNTAVLINGRRVNEIDLSGVNWAQIPLDQVERIEISRGAGTVLYGDNAVGGIINIITKKGEGKPKIEAGVETGSYQMNKEKISAGGSFKNLSYALNASRHSTNGYRRNSYAENKNGSLYLAYKVNPDISLNVSGGYYDSDYGLPGALSEEHLKTMSRRDTRYPDDDASETEYYVKAGGQKEIVGWGYFDIEGSFRRKDMTSKYLSSSAGFNPIYQNKIDTIGFTPKYILDINVFGHANKAVTGIDFYRSDYTSDNYNEADTLQNYADIDKTSLGIYAQDELVLFDKISTVLGYRTEKAKYTFNYHDLTGVIADVDSKLDPRKDAYNLGLAYKYLEDSSAFVNVSKSFRFPATDEYFSIYATPPVNTGLNPQTGKHYEVGVKHTLGRYLILDGVLYRMDLENELYYDPSLFANLNYDKTRHEGLELGAVTKIGSFLEVRGNYIYTRAWFDGGVYDKNDIPAVPRHKASFTARWLLPKGLGVNFIGNYVGKRFFISDQANSLPQMDDYFTLDSNLSYVFKGLTFKAGVNNIFNKKYSEYGVKSGTLRYYYPSPERNYTFSVNYDF